MKVISSMSDRELKAAITKSLKQKKSAKPYKDEIARRKGGPKETVSLKKKLLAPSNTRKDVVQLIRCRDGKSYNALDELPTEDLLALTDIFVKAATKRMDIEIGKAIGNIMGIMVGGRNGVVEKELPKPGTKAGVRSNRASNIRPKKVSKASKK